METNQLKSGSFLQDGKYRIERVLGQGGFGITYLAEQTKLDRKVAVKEFFFRDCCERLNGASSISLGTQANAEMVRRFQTKFVKEAKTISQLDHPNIIHIYDIFDENNTSYYVMEYVDGQSLSEYVKAHGPLPEKTALAYISQIGSALSYIHARSINHLDVKPGNIMLRKTDGQVVLIDFGLAKQYDSTGSQTSTTPVGISQGYAPIEQYRAGGVAQFSPQTDVYSLGATLYWLVLGKTPPPADEVLDEGLPELPATISLPVRNAIQSAMKARKKERPETVEDFLRLLGTSVGSESSRGDQGTDDETMILDNGTGQGKKSGQSEEETVVTGGPGKPAGGSSSSLSGGTSSPLGGSSSSPMSVKKNQIIAGAAVLALLIIGLVIWIVSKSSSMDYDYTGADEDEEELVSEAEADWADDADPEYIDDDYYVAVDSVMEDSVAYYDDY